MNGIINDAVKGEGESVEVQVFDLEKAFDSLWLLDCCNDMYDSLDETNRRDELELLFKMNEKNLTSVKTAHGLTDRVNIPNIVQQGGIFGSLLCSNSTNRTGRLCNERKQSLFKHSSFDLR